MSRFLRWLASSIGYLLYTALVLVVMLWVLLPRQSIRLWLQGQLNTASPDLQWEIKEVNAALPGVLVATGLRLRETGTNGEEVLLIDELRVLPDFKSLLASRKDVTLRYQLRTLDGSLRGTAALLEGGSKLRCDGEAQDLELGKLASLWNSLGRTVAGKLSGQYRFEGAWREPDQGSLTADLRAIDGGISLLQPVFGLEQLEFSQLAGSLQLQAGTMALSKGKFESRMLAGEFTGTLSLADTLALSQLKVDGSLEPRPELLGGLRDQAVVTMIKKQLRENKLSFALSGTVLEPGIQFRGVSGAIDGIIQGGGR